MVPTYRKVCLININSIVFISKGGRLIEKELTAHACARWPVRTVHAPLPLDARAPLVNKSEVEL